MVEENQHRHQWQLSRELVSLSHGVMEDFGQVFNFSEPVLWSVKVSVLSILLSFFEWDHTCDHTLEISILLLVETLQNLHFLEAVLHLSKTEGTSKAGLCVSAYQWCKQPLEMISASKSWSSSSEGLKKKLTSRMQERIFEII